MARKIRGAGSWYFTKEPRQPAEVQRALMVKTAADFDEQRVFLGTLNSAGDVLAASDDRTQALAP